MEYLLSEFMYFQTHIYLKRFLFFILFSCIKGKENESDFMANVWMIKTIPTGWGPPLKLALKHKFDW
jgi:hypothetical protein